MISDKPLTLFQKLVCKVDQLVKRRAKSGLIRVNVDWSDAKEFINQHLGKEIKVRSISGHFFAICLVICHKTEVQTVILRCLTSLNLNWFQRYDEKRKKAKNANLHFFDICNRHRKGKYLHFVS